MDDGNADLRKAGAGDERTRPEGAARRRQATRSPRVVVLGAGFGGLAAARRLEATVGRAADVVLVDRHNYSLFAPLLPEAATGTISGVHVAAPLRRFFRTTRTRQADVESVEPDRHRVRVRHGAAFEPRDHEIEYDHLVLALGSTTSFFGLPGLADHAFTLGSLGDALRIGNRVIDAFEQADVDTDERRRRDLLTFVVGGGSFTGGATSAEADHVVVGDDSAVLTRTVVWAAGLEPPSALADVPLAKDDRGWVETDETLRVRGREDVWALGDVASVPDGRGGTYPATAQHSARQGAVAADNVVRALEGRGPGAFRYDSPGVFVGLGHRSGFGSVRGRTLTGFPAWMAWRSFYLAKMPTMSRRIRVGADWLVHTFSGPDIAEVPLERRPATPARV